MSAEQKSDPKAPEEEKEPECPICAFIEGGACKQTHREWVKCRDEAKEKGDDYVDTCQDSFKTFLQCTFDNADYYAPFHSMLQGLEEGFEIVTEEDPSAAAQAQPQAQAQQ